MKKQKSKLPFRIFYAKDSIEKIILSCLISCAIVCAGVLIFYHKPLTTVMMVALCLILCLLTCMIAEHFLVRSAGAFIEPIEIVNDSLKKVAKGDFSVEISPEVNEKHIEELEELIDNFNRTVHELNGMDYMRKDFMSNVSHEIKTPIASIMGFTEMLQDENLNDEERMQYLKLLNDEANRLSRLCSNMLKISRFDNQAIIAKDDSINVAEQIRKILIMMVEKWEEKEINLDIDVADFEIMTNKDLLLEVWINLFDNAFKYSDSGTTIHVKSEKVEDSFAIIIQDEGIGIPKEKITHIFDKFYQCDESHKKVGNGLGLAIVKRIIELLDYSISCESVEGCGTKFTVLFN